MTTLSPKTWLKSKTIWLGFIQLAIALLTYWQGSLETGTALTISGFATIILRFLTTAKITL